MTPFFFGGAGKMEMRYGESKTLTFKNLNGSPLANKQITLTLEDGHTQPLHTNSNGTVTFDQLTVRHYKWGNSKENGGVAGTPMRTDYRQYVFTLAGYKARTVSLTQLKSSESITMEEG
jgi:hypothetical protein